MKPLFLNVLVPDRANGLASLGLHHEAIIQNNCLLGFLSQSPKQPYRVVYSTRIECQGKVY